MEKLVFLLVWAAALMQGFMAKALPYDYSASVECLAEPLEPHYGGGIIVNPDFNAGLQGWSAFGYGRVEEGASVATGNRYAVAVNRTRPYHSVSQKVYLQNDTHYTLSAWFQVSHGAAAAVRAVVKTADDFVHVGGAVAKPGCWSMLKGGLTAAKAGRAELYFESNATVDIWVDNVSLKPFTKEEWAAHRSESTRTTRRKTVRLQATDSAGNPLQNAEVSVENVRTSFPLGAAMSGEILHNAAYQQWFTSRFTVTTFENEMKWYSTERAPGQEDYTVADAMLALAKQHGIGVRGHNVFWDDPKQQPRWVQSLPYPDLLAAASRRIRSFVSRYAGQLIAWDVVNENLHFSFFERQFGWDASTAFYAAARLLDAGSSLMFMNDFNTLEQPGDMAAVPGRYVDRLKQIIASYPENGAGMAIGLEGHFTTPNIPYMRAALDSMSTVGVPVWLTEVDVAGGPMQAQYLEEVLREAYAHPAVQGVIPCGRRGTPTVATSCASRTTTSRTSRRGTWWTGRLLAEWRTAAQTGTTDAQGHFQAEVAHGEYKVTVSHPSLNTSVSQSVTVELGSGNHFFIQA